MMAKQVTQPQVPLTHNARYREAQAKANEAFRLFRDAQETWANAEAARFEAAGGCQHCQGRGWVVTWDTLDHMDGSDASYGSCPEPTCTAETRLRTGLNLAQRETKYFRWHSVSSDHRDMTFEQFLAKDLMYQLMVVPFVKAHAVHERLASDLHARCQPAKGDKVVVVKGRKVPLGHVGVVAFIKQDGGLLVKAEHEWQDRNANGVWVDPRNVEIVVR